MAKRNSYTIALTPEQQKALVLLLKTGNYRPVEVEYTQIAARKDDCTIALYRSGKCVVQGKGAEEFVLFTLEPEILLEAKVGYEPEQEPDPASSQPHMGIDESGKGDFFGPLVIAAAYVDGEIAGALRKLGVRDSKTLSSDKRAEDMADAIRHILGHRFVLVPIGPAAYNRLYAKIRNVNRMLAWGHARAIEDLLERVPDCPRAVADQFGPQRQIQQALMKKGRRIELHQRPRAESDVAVAAASVLARAAFVRALRGIQKDVGVDIPKGASAQVREAASELVRKSGPKILLSTAKCHFKTADAVLESAGHSRADLGPEGAATSQAKTPFRRAS